MTNTMNAAATIASAIFAGVAVIISYNGYKSSRDAVEEANRIAQTAAEEVARFNEKTILQNLVLNGKNGSIKFDEKLLEISGHLILVIGKEQEEKVLDYGQTLIFDQVNDINLKIDELQLKLASLNFSKEKAIAFDTKKSENKTVNIKFTKVNGELNIAKSEQNKIESQIKNREAQVNNKLKTIKSLLDHSPNVDTEKKAKENQIDFLKKQIKEDNLYITEDRKQLILAELKTKGYQERANSIQIDKLRIEAELKSIKHEFLLILKEREHLLKKSS